MHTNVKEWEKQNDNISCYFMLTSEKKIKLSGVLYKTNVFQWCFRNILSNLKFTTICARFYFVWQIDIRHMRDDVEINFNCSWLQMKFSMSYILGLFLIQWSEKV